MFLLKPWRDELKPKHCVVLKCYKIGQLTEIGIAFLGEQKAKHLSMCNNPEFYGTCMKKTC